MRVGLGFGHRALAYRKQTALTCQGTSMSKLLYAAIIGLVFFLFFAMPFITGSTFGQRCAKAYPDDPVQQEWCVERLSKGGLVYPKLEGLGHPYE